MPIPSSPTFWIPLDTSTLLRTTVYGRIWNGGQRVADQLLGYADDDSRTRYLDTGLHRPRHARGRVTRHAIDAPSLFAEKSGGSITYLSCMTSN